MIGRTSVVSHHLQSFLDAKVIRGQIEEVPS